MLLANPAITGGKNDPLCALFLSPDVGQFECIIHTGQDIFYFRRAYQDIILLLVKWYVGDEKL